MKQLKLQVNNNEKNCPKEDSLQDLNKSVHTDTLAQQHEVANGSTINKSTSMLQFTIKQSLQAQLQLGHSTSEWNPLMASFLQGHRNNHHIFDMSTTCLHLKRALQVLSQNACQGGQTLFLGKSPKTTTGSSKKTNPYMRILETAAVTCHQPYFNGDLQSWTSGTFTNWNEYLHHMISSVGAEGQLEKQNGKPFETDLEDLSKPIGLASSSCK